MPRYLVQRTFAEGLGITATREGARRCLGIVETNGVHGITWIHSHVTAHGSLTYCIYEGPSPGAIPGLRGPTASRSTGSPRCGCSTRTSTTEPRTRATRPEETSCDASTPSIRGG